MKKANITGTTENKNGWLVRGICLSLLLSLLFTSLYGVFNAKSKRDALNPLEQESTISWLFQNSLLLYRDLYNKKNHTNASFQELFFSPVEGYEWVVEEANQGTADSNTEVEWKEERSETLSVDTDVINSLRHTVVSITDYFTEMERLFYTLNNAYDYLIEDLESDKYVTNLLDQNISIQEQFFYISFLFDADGNCSVEGDISGNDTTSIRKYANAVLRESSLQGIAEACFDSYDLSEAEVPKYFDIKGPQNCRVTFCVSNASWEKMQEEGFYLPNGYYVSHYYSFTDSGVISVLGLFVLTIFCLAFYLPRAGEGDPWKRYKLFRMPLEAILALGMVLFVTTEFIIALAQQVSNGDMTDGLLTLVAWMPSRTTAKMIVYLFNITMVAAYFFTVWVWGILLRSVRVMGFREYIRKRCIIYRIFPFLKTKITGIYHAVTHFDVTKKAHKLILKIVLINAVILFVISSLWMGGLAVAIIYSVLLYFVLRKYISDLQKKYGILLGAINKIAEGDLNVAISEDLGVFEPFKPQVFRIQNGFKKAVDQEVKSQRMKAELITNVSHDLKTPLTAIITYINLLKEENITEEQRKSYLDTLERKSIRLKVLIEDLFEVSKANSGNLTLNIVNVDIMNLVKQVSFEMSDKLSDANLDLRLNLSEQKVLLPLDSQKTYRIYENLFGNIAKYALPGTRVYIDAEVSDKEVEIILKNITARELNVDVEELTDRFVRGDASRNTEGSGLGLAIAKSFMELQNGKLSLQVDGDLFKVSTIWRRS